MKLRSWLAHTAVWFLLAFGIAGAQSSPSGQFQLEEATIDDVHAAMTAGALKCRDLVQMYLDRIEAYDKKGPNLNTIQTINPRALELADELDASFASLGFVGSLHCIPVLLKDQVETSDLPTSYGSVLFEDFVPERDATIVLKMKSAGAIILAKSTMGEFASRYVGSAFGMIRNAYDPDRNPSGSSGGTGSGIAANFGMVGIGEDTGGSIRGPASANCLVGLRPTVPLVSRHGMMPAVPATDTLGPMTRTVSDAAALLDVIAGYDENDALTAYAVGQVPDSYASGLREDGLKGARIGVIREPMDGRTDPETDDYKKVRAVIDAAISDLRSSGAQLIDPVVIPNMAELLQRSGRRFEIEQAMNAYLEEHGNSPVKTLQEILLSGKVTPWRARSLIRAVGRKTSDAGHLQVLLAKEELRLSVLKVMAGHELDALVYATYDHQPSVIPADVLTNPEPEDEYNLGTNMALSPLTGFPALTVPAGFTTDALPAGLELLGRPFTEAMLLNFAYSYEQASRRRKPPPLAPPLAR